jgi:bifunctional UDP-N-acetylglucosamine pyrophosphorylase / glucosamine-1-phosphate N-acetyltransferase
MKRPWLALVLAAGEGKRFRSATTKVLHPLLGRTMLEHVLRTTASLKPARTIVIVGRQAEDVAAEAARFGAESVRQEERRGTGHAVLSARRVLTAWAGLDILVLPADLPLLGAATIRALLAAHRRRENVLTILSAEAGDPSRFGRIVRGAGGTVRIVEDRDADAATRKIREVNSAVYVFEGRALLGALSKLTDRNRSGELYLTDAADILSKRGLRVGVFAAPRPAEIVQVNTRVDLARAIDVLRARKISALGEGGVTVLGPSSTWIDMAAEIAPDTTIYPGAVIEGPTVIGPGCRIYPGAHIIRSRLGSRVTVLSSTFIEDSTLEDDVSIGPFARLRPRTVLRAGARVGNFVEMKNTDFGPGSKAGHLSYLGDSDVGEKVNIGAGTITCNYDGFRKSRTVIEAGAFIGSGTELIAPVKVGRGAYVAAGSVITKDVSPEALAVARGRQVEKEGWARRMRERAAKPPGPKA